MYDKENKKKNPMFQQKFLEILNIMNYDRGRTKIKYLVKYYNKSLHL